MSRWLQITAGQGPAECQWAVARLVELIQGEAVRQGLNCRLLETIPGEKNDTMKSALLAIEGPAEANFAAGWQGTIQWVGKSPYRPNHKRKNWFVGVEVYVPPEQPQWSDGDVRVDVMRSAGPGGQHVNKTSSAIRITHLPTGLTVVAREERSQQQNRRLASARLAQLLKNQRTGAEAELQRRRWQQHAELERGKPVCVFEGPDFRRRRDRRTKADTAEN